MSANSRSMWFVSVLATCVFLASQTMAADVYQGIAKFKNAEGKQDTATFTISLERATPEAERSAMIEKVRTSPQAAKTVLAAQPQLGYIEVRERRVAIRYAYVSDSMSGQTISVLSDEPLGFIGGAKRSAPSKEGFDLTYAMINMKASGKGNGEMAPAAKVKWMKSGAPAPDRYDDKIVWLEDVVKVTQP